MLVVCNDAQVLAIVIQRVHIWKMEEQNTLIKLQAIREVNTKIEQTEILRWIYVYQ